MQPADRRDAMIAEPTPPSAFTPPPPAPGPPPPARRGGLAPAPPPSRMGAAAGGWRTTRLLWFAVSVVDSFLALDLVFRLASANDIGFAALVLRVGDALSMPFQGIFANLTARGGAVIRWSDLVALVIYTLVAWAVVTLVRIASSPGTST
jgi:hypothetical protein